MFFGFASNLALFALVQLSSGLELPERYIKMPLQMEGMKDGTFDHKLSQIRPTGLVLEAGSRPEEVLAQLRKFADPKGPELAGDFLAAAFLRQLADDEANCNHDNVYRFLTLYQVYRSTNEAKNPDVMLNFLEHFGKRKFQRCAPEALESIRRKVGQNSGDFQQVREFFRLALSLRRGVENESLYNALKQFKPLESSYNMANLAQVSELNLRGETAYDRVENKYKAVCAFVARHLTRELDVLNIANGLAPEAKYFERDPKLGQLNEIHRACLETDGGQDLREHMRKLAQYDHDLIYPSKPRPLPKN